jgi:hypothetical protein
MLAFSHPVFWYRFFTEFICHKCGSRAGFVSRARNRFERYGLRLVLLRMARCGECYRRSCHPLWVPLAPRAKAPSADHSLPPAATVSAEHQVAGKGKETGAGAEQQRRIA